MQARSGTTLIIMGAVQPFKVPWAPYCVKVCGRLRQAHQHPMCSCT